MPGSAGRQGRAPAAGVKGRRHAQATFNTLVSAALNRQIKFKTTDKSIMAAGVTDAANKAVKKSKRRRSPLAVAWMSMQARGRCSLLSAHVQAGSCALEPRRSRRASARASW